MNSKHPWLFDLDALRDLAGNKVFARGKRYFDDARVEILAIEPDRVLAQVSGTEEYRTILTGRRKRIGGKCTCPAFEDWGVCKHMVATALTANAMAAASDAGNANMLPSVRDYLKTMSVDALVETILKAAERDPLLFRELQNAAVLARADDKTLMAHLQKAIDTATRTGKGVDDRAAARWAGAVDETLDSIDALLPAGHGAAAMTLALHAIDRISAAVANIDDSDGYCSPLLQRAEDIHLAAARTARPDPIRLARDVFKREIESDYGVFDGAMRRYADVFGESGLDEYRRLATEAWEKLPPLTERKTRNEDAAGGYGRLLAILDVFAEQRGDVDERIALRTKDLSSPWHYLQLGEFCLSAHRESEALRWAEEGLWLFEDQMDERLVSFTVALLTKTGRAADATDLLRQTFGKRPSLALYSHLATLGGKAAKDEMQALLESRAASRQNMHRQAAELLVQILIEEKALDRAWSVVRRHGASDGTTEMLARASEKSHPEDAIKVYAARVDALANTGGNPAYVQAMVYVGRIATLQSKIVQANYVAALKTRFSAKRNFIKLLG